MLLEVCANCFQSAENAYKAGTKRIELCQNLSVGGLTPSVELVQKVLDAFPLTVHVLIRPRPGDFLYADDEFEQMLKSIENFKKMGCHGIVAGVLKSNKSVDLLRTKELIDRSAPLSFTFHRAFDNVDNPEQSFKDLMGVGVDRLLTSGQMPRAIEGFALLRALHLRSEKRLIVMPGAGIGADHIGLFKTANFQEVHASASRPRTPRDHDPFNLDTTVSDFQTIQKLLDALYPQR